MESSIRIRETQGFLHRAQAAGTGSEERQRLADTMQAWCGRLEVELGLFRIQLVMIRELEDVHPEDSLDS